VPDVTVLLELTLVLPVIALTKEFLMMVIVKIVKKDILKKMMVIEDVLKLEK